MLTTEQERELSYLEELVRWFEVEIREHAAQRDKLWARIDELTRLKLTRLKQDEE